MRGRKIREELDKPFEDSAIDLYANMTGSPKEMLELVRLCPDCKEPILVPDNAVFLDAKPSEGPSHPAAMGIMKLGPMFMAASGALDGGTHHMIHDHQPPEVD